VTTIANQLRVRLLCFNLKLTSAMAMIHSNRTMLQPEIEDITPGKSVLNEGATAFSPPTSC
jgi:hypothetical protein